MLLFILVAFLACTTISTPLQSPLTGFTTTPYWQEQQKVYKLANIGKDAITVQFNAPSAASWRADVPTRLVLYFLPNGNTINQTQGRSDAPGVDWHYLIQQIGAQTRRVRELTAATPAASNLVVAYLQAASLSWPVWTKANAKYVNAVVQQAVQTLQQAIAPPASPVRVTLSAHSGGGSFLFAFLAANPAALPENIERIVFLDATYNYDEKKEYGPQLLQFVTGVRNSSSAVRNEASASSLVGRNAENRFRASNERNCLIIVAYDDRNITLNGKPVNCPTCGTFRHTHSFISFLAREQAQRNEIRLTLEGPNENRTGTVNPIDTWTLSSQRDGGAFCLNIQIHRNPKNRILHTVLVQMNGYLHGQTSDGLRDTTSDFFYGPLDYTKWIQKGY